MRLISDWQQGRERIEIEVQDGQAEDRKHVLRDIREELNRIHRLSFPRLCVSEKIPCCCGECRLSPNPNEYDNAKLDNLHNNRGKEKVQCDRSGEMISIRQLQEGIFPNMERVAEVKANSAQPSVIIHNHLQKADEASEKSTKRPWYLYLGLFIADVLTILANLAQFTGWSLSNILQWWRQM